MLMSVFRVLVNNPVKENFYGKRKKKTINILTIFFLFPIKVMSVGDEKVSFSTNKIYVGLEGLNRNLTMGLMRGPKAIGEDSRSPLYFIPWA